MKSNPLVDKPLFRFFLIAVVLSVIRFVFGYMRFPESAIFGVQIASAIIFVVGPVWALYEGSAHIWNRMRAFGFLISGVAIHALCEFSVKTLLPPTGMATVLAQTAVQFGLLMWCLGLGALVSLLIKEKNLLPPIAMFLAGFDIFLVFSPFTFTNKIIQRAPEVLSSVAMKVPDAITNAPQAAVELGARIEPLVLVGPADLLFVAAFFACLFKFNMRTKETKLWLGPVLVGYLLLVMLPLGIGALPALVPIGATVLLVNRKEFAMPKEERQATIGVGVIAGLLALAGLYFAFNPPARPIEPSQQQDAPVPQEQQGSPVPTGSV